MTPHAALAALRENPVNFLENYYVSVAGSLTPSGTIPYFIKTMGGGVRTNRGDRRATRAFDIDHLTPGDGLSFRAHSIKMLPADSLNIQALVGHLVPFNTGPDLMVTGQITNCTFCCLWTPDGVLMTHIQPRGTTGPELCTAIKQRGIFQGHPAAGFIPYGEGNGYTSRENVSIIGVRKNGMWSVYAQVHPRPGYDMSKKVIRVDTVYP